MRRIKNRDKLTKEDLIITFLKSASSAAERNFEKLFSNNTDDDDDDDDTYDGKIRGKISDIRMILSRLQNIVTKNARKKITKELYEIKKKENLSNRKKKRYLWSSCRISKYPQQKRKYKYHDLDDQDYYGIRDGIRDRWHY